MRRMWPYLAIVVGLVVFYYWKYRTAPSLEFGEIKLTNSSGETVTANEVLTDKSVLHFYASWCGPCMRELKEIRDHYTELEKLGIVFHCVTDDDSETINKMRALMPESIHFYRINSLAEAGINTLPTTYFLSEKNVLHKQVETVDWTNQEKINSYFNR